MLIAFRGHPILFGIEVTASGKTYRDILRTSSIMGGAQVLTYVVGLARVKLVALLLGPTGVGLVSVYSSAVTLLGTVASLGIPNSAVRDIARASGDGDTERAAQSTAIVRRAGWLTGIGGSVLAIVLAYPMNVWLLGGDSPSWPFAVLGLCVLLNVANAGQLAVLQGSRRVKDIARASVLSAFIGTVAALAMYALIGKQGIVPALIVTSLVTLAISARYARSTATCATTLSWRETFAGMQNLSRLGSAFVWNGLLVAGMDAFMRAVIVRESGLNAAGMYQAAWALSGMFAAFILTAMGADFYPRLAAVILNKQEAAQVINQQTEIGILLALPGLIATICFADLALQLFYTVSFAPAATVLQVLVVGVFCRIISWPMGFVQPALGRSRLFMATESMYILVQGCLAFTLVPAIGLLGAACAFSGAQFLYTLCMLYVSRSLIELRWSLSVRRMVWSSVVLVACAFASARTLHGLAGLVVRFSLVVACTIWTARGLVLRTSSDFPSSGKLGSMLQWLKRRNVRVP